MCLWAKAYKVIQNKRYFTSNNYGFYSVLHPNSTAKKVPKFPETVKFQQRCTEFRLRSGFAPYPVVGSHIAPHVPSVIRGRGRSEERGRGEGARNCFEASRPGGTMIRPCRTLTYTELWNSEKFRDLKNLRFFERLDFSRSRRLAISLHSTPSIDLGWVNVRAYNYFSSVDLSSPGFFSVNMGWALVDHLLFWFLISQSIPEIFANQVWSCPKSPRILHVFGSHIFSEGPQILGPRL